MNADDERAGPTWRSSLERAMKGIEAGMVYLCEPDKLERRPEYRKRPGDLWLSLILRRVESATTLQAIGAKRGELTGEEMRRLEELLHTARECIRRNLSWVKEQLRRELEELVRPYATANWIE